MYEKLNLVFDKVKEKFSLLFKSKVAPPEGGLIYSMKRQMTTDHYHVMLRISALTDRVRENEDKLEKRVAYLETMLKQISSLLPMSLQELQDELDALKKKVKANKTKKVKKTSD